MALRQSEGAASQGRSAAGAPRPFLLPNEPDEAPSPDAGSRANAPVLLPVSATSPHLNEVRGREVSPDARCTRNGNARPIHEQVQRVSCLSRRHTRCSVFRGAADAPMAPTGGRVVPQRIGLPWWPARPGVRRPGIPRLGRRVRLLALVVAVIAAGSAAVATQVVGPSRAEPGAVVAPPGALVRPLAEEAPVPTELPELSTGREAGTDAGSELGPTPAVVVEVVPTATLVHAADVSRGDPVDVTELSVMDLEAAPSMVTAVSESPPPVETEPEAVSAGPDVEETPEWQATFTEAIGMLATVGTNESPLAAVHVWEPILVWTVRSGDNLAAIAEDFRTTVQAIAERNGFAEQEPLWIGQQVEVPVGFMQDEVGP